METQGVEQRHLNFTRVPSATRLRDVRVRRLTRRSVSAAQLPVYRPPASIWTDERPGTGSGPRADSEQNKVNEAVSAASALAAASQRQKEVLSSVSLQVDQRLAEWTERRSRMDAVLGQRAEQRFLRPSASATTLRALGHIPSASARAGPLALPAPANMDLTSSSASSSQPLEPALSLRQAAGSSPAFSSASSSSSFPSASPSVPTPLNGPATAAAAAPSRPSRSSAPPPTGLSASASAMALPREQRESTAYELRRSESAAAVLPQHQQQRRVRFEPERTTDGGEAKTGVAEASFSSSTGLALDPTLRGSVIPPSASSASASALPPSAPPAQPQQQSRTGPAASIPASSHQQQQQQQQQQQESRSRRAPAAPRRPNSAAARIRAQKVQVAFGQGYIVGRDPPR